MLKQMARLHMQKFKAHITHKHTAAPRFHIYKFIHVHAAGPVYTCTCSLPLFKMYKLQTPFKHARLVGPADIYMHHQQGLFTYVQAAGSVCILNSIRSLFKHAYAAGPICTCTRFHSHISRPVYTCKCSRSGLHMHKRKANKPRLHMHM